MTARATTEALPGGRWHGSSGTACCPCHEDHEPSLSITDGQDGRLLVHCFAGQSNRFARFFFIESATYSASA